MAVVAMVRRTNSTHFDVLIDVGRRAQNELGHEQRANIRRVRPVASPTVDSATLVDNSAS